MAKQVETNTPRTYFGAALALVAVVFMILMAATDVLVYGVKLGGGIALGVAIVGWLVWTIIENKRK